MAESGRRREDLDVAIVGAGVSGVWCELGGMRFTPAQPLVGGLINELHLATHPFPVGEGLNINYLRGTYIRQQEFSDPTTSLPYDLAWAERGMNPEFLVAWVGRRPLRRRRELLGHPRP